MARPKRDSVYQSKVVSSDSVKKTTTFQGIPIHIDRPVGLIMTGRSKSGEEWAREYLYDYGFIPGTLGGDGDDLDVFVGPHDDAKEAYWAIQNKADGSFDEYKVFLGFSSRDAAIGAYRDHIPVKLLAGMVSMRMDMMKALLGKHPDGSATYKTNVKTAMAAVSFSDALARLVLILVLLLSTRPAYADDGVQTIPSGEDVIVVVHKGDAAPFTGQLFDNATSVRWALWLQQYKQLLPLHDTHAKQVCQADLDHERALKDIDAREAQAVTLDLKQRLTASEQRNAELENPAWYRSSMFYFAIGAIGSAGLTILAIHAAR